MKTIVSMAFGSRLYGLESPDSDYDTKLIHVPDIEDCLLMTATKNIQLKDELDNSETESFALQTFLENAAGGQAFAMDMLHSSEHHWQNYSYLWKYIWTNKSKFYTKKLNGMCGYARGQANKYSIKAERMNSTKKVLDALYAIKKQSLCSLRLEEGWHLLPDCEFTERGVDQNNRNEDKRYYEICGKKLQPAITIDYAIEIVTRLYNSFGARVAAVAHLDQKEWKSISHAFRVGFQLYEIYKNGGYSYPLPQTEFLRDLKFAKLDYVGDKIEKRLDDLLHEVDALAEASTLPEKVDQKFVKQIIFEAYEHSPSH